VLGTAITTLLLTTVAELSTKSHEEDPVDRDGSMMRRLSKNSAFISAVGIYISHADPSIRRCGMLVAEVRHIHRIALSHPYYAQIVAQRTGGKLKFPDWDGEGEDKKWARTMRSLVEGRDSTANLTLLTMAKKETEATPTVIQADHDKTPSLPRGITVVDDGEDSDDSLEGYASSLDSRSSSPILSSVTATRTKESIKSKAETMITPTVEEINADPTLLNPSRKKIQKPIYLLDLGKLLKVDKEGDEQCESIRMALQNAAILIRKKAGWGLELGACSVK
jgi:telomere length regulation protein